jgi:hypothetical protein
MVTISLRIHVAFFHLKEAGLAVSVVTAVSAKGFSAE